MSIGRCGLCSLSKLRNIWMVPDDVIHLLMQLDVMTQQMVDSLVRFGQFVMQLAIGLMTALL